MHTIRWTGAGTAADRLCGACAQLVADGAAVATGVVCEACFDDADGDCTGVVGAPEVRERPVGLDRTVRATALPEDPVPVVDLAGLPGPGTVWLLLHEDGRLVRWDSEGGGRREVARARVAPDAAAEPWAGHVQRRRLHTSPDGRFAAVVIDHGSTGEVLDLTTGARTMTLDGGTYHAETVPFALAFTEYRGRPVVIHRTDWNRLDASDPETGRLLTAREFEPAAPGERPAHDLDFFHGALHVSTEGEYIADDGWFWSPEGVCTTWSLPAWLGSDVHESEDGQSLATAAQASYHWNRPVVWLDDRRVAIGGLGDDDERMAPGVRIVDAGRSEPTGSGSRSAVGAVEFGGPDGPLFAADGLLFSAGPDGLDVWDPSDGARLGRVPGFRPVHHHRPAGELVRIDGGRLLRWRTPGPAAGRRRTGAGPR
ncbi:hypothetical protein [Kitasatospora paranensis]|uniref:hypothetical protein n=1 Tax=Kitasatospora paranensis TaxID=258053 RepID=UPI0031EF4F13